MNAFRVSVSICVLVGHLAGTAGAIDMETVPVGNPGNTGDTRYLNGDAPSYGSVAYTYNIGKYEVTAGQYTEFLNKVGGVDTYGLYSGGMLATTYGSGITRNGGGIVGDPYTYSVAPDFANRPVNYVSYWDACRFANWLHNGQPTGVQGAGTTETGAYTLTTNGMTDNTVTHSGNWKWAVTSEDEWYKAAYHKNNGVTGNYFAYPTSSDAPPTQDMADVSGNNANYYTFPYVFPIDSGRYTTIVGEFQNSASPYGTFDQGGNVWEWNESVLHGSFRGLRGGSVETDRYSLHAQNSNTTYPTDELYYRGFRVSEVPEPAVLAMWGLGGVLLIRRKR